MDIEIKQLLTDDISLFTDLIYLFEHVFEMENFQIPSQKHLQSVLDNKDFFAIVAIKDNRVVGGLTVYILHQYYYEKPLAYIYDLAVSIQLQRQGIGKRLIDFTNTLCKEKGYEEVFVQAEKEDEHAVDFYRSTNAAEKDVSHFYYSFI